MRILAINDKLETQPDKYKGNNNPFDMPSQFTVDTFER